MLALHVPQSVNPALVLRYSEFVSEYDRVRKTWLRRSVWPSKTVLERTCGDDGGLDARPYTQYINLIPLRIESHQATATQRFRAQQLSHTIVLNHTPTFFKMKYTYALLALAAAATAAPTANPDAQPEANPDGYGKYANYGTHP